MPLLKRKPATTLSLLRQIRDVMAQAASAQARLDKVVTLIAAGFNSQVCSVYLLRAGDILELFASEGLKKASVHQTRLAVGQGLVGAIAASAAPLNLANADAHPKFEYRPETGEEIYKSFVGVPILQGGKVIGVLVVQGKAAKRYAPAKLELLQTVAMVLSELAISGQLITREEIKSATGNLMAQQLTGVALSPGMAKAVAVLHQPQLTITHYVATDLELEKERIEISLAALQESFSRYIETSGLTPDNEQREIIETYMLFTQDRGWRAKIDEAINSGLTAEASVKKVQEELQAKMSQMASPYIKERIQDLEDLSSHLLQALMGKAITHALDLPEAFILVARNIGPAELLAYDHKRLKGLILEEGSLTSHTAVIARAMDIPAIAKVDSATAIIQPGDMVIADAESPVVYVRPTNQVEQAVDQYLKQYAEKVAQYEALRDVEAVTKDGIRISLNINAGLFVDSASVLQEGVDGIGLYRTELPYMTSENFPEADMQQELYAKMVTQLPGKRIIFRSFDIGGDKKVPYLDAGEEENPAMGWRAIRIGLDRPGILRTQFKALIAATAGHELWLMFPFIAEVAEFVAAKKLFDLELEAAAEKPSSVKIGIMIEIPSILWQLDALFEDVDFVSIGSNDLMQFLFACDRGAAQMAGHYDTLSPVMLRILRKISEKAAAHNVIVSFCGEMGRKPIDAMAILGAGITSLSVPASSIGPLKAMIRSLTLKPLKEYLNYVTDSSEPSVRQWIAAYARDHGISI